jgi:O-antigen/teichoic acid export membrane protein
LKKSFQRTAIDTFTNGGAQFLLIPLTFIRLPILTKNLSAQEYGVWGLIFTTCSLTLPLTSLGLGAAMSRFLPGEKNKELIKEGFYSVLFIRLFISFAIALTVYLFASPISTRFFDGSTQIVQLTAAFIFLATLSPVYKRLLRIIRKVKILSIIKIIDGYGTVGLYAVVLFTGHGLISIILVALSFRVAVIVFMILYVKPYIHFKWPNFSQLRRYLQFGLPTLPASLSFWVVNLTDRFIIVYYMGAASVGIYSAAYALGNIPRMFSGLINFIMMIAISKLYDEGKIDEVKTHLSYGLKYFLALSIPFLFGSVIFSEQVLRVLSTPEIATQGRYITPIVVLSHIFLGVYSILTYIIVVVKKTKIMALVWMLSLPLNLGLNIIIIPYYGILGAAVTTLIAYSLALCIVSYFALKEFTFNANWIFIFKSLVASTIMSIMILFLAPQKNVYIFLTIVVGMCIYGLTLILLKGFSRKEYDFFKGLFKTKFTKRVIV